MKIKLGTRASLLAVTQTGLIAQELEQLGFIPEVITLQSQGDRNRSQTEKVKDKQEWISGIDTAVANKTIDLAIHSAKDLPVEILPGTRTIPIMPRAFANDLLIFPQSASRHRISDLPSQFVIGTSSLRRKAQLLHLQPDLQVVTLNGNIDTRLQKLSRREGGIEAILLAAAGVQRLSLNVNGSQLPIKDFLPAVNQGNLVAQYHGDNEQIETALFKLSGQALIAQYYGERRVIELLNADCNSAVGVYAKVIKEQVRITAAVYSHDGQKKIEAESVGATDSYLDLAAEVSAKLLSAGAGRILAQNQENYSQ